MEKKIENEKWFKKLLERSEELKKLEDKNLTQSSLKQAIRDHTIANYIIFTMLGLTIGLLIKTLMGC